MSEETDLSWRLNILGYKIYYFPKIHTWHPDIKKGKRIQSFKDRFKIYLACRNILTTYFKNLSTSKLIHILSINIFFWVLLSLYYLIKLKPANSLAVYKALYWHLANIKETFEKRNYWQLKRKVSDKEIFMAVGIKVPLKYYFRKAIGYKGY